ncbi:MAG: ATP-binding cassette domain-containing protein [Gemmatimonadaceae bacterium]|nr:ATP-binding cassette domain-containing protein [Gemmatimonadaceae bacterium]
MPDAALDLHDVTVRYGTARHTALDSASLSVAAGECVGVVAGPGSGLTTLLLVAAGLVGPDAGHVRWFGSHRWTAARAAYAPGAALGHPYLSLRAWLDFSAAQGPELPGGPEPDVNAAMELAELHAFARIRVGHLTAGLSARLAMAAALLVEPRVLLLDRPFDPLSQAERARFAQVVRRVVQGGTAVVVGAREAEFLAAMDPARVHLLAGGRLGPHGDCDTALEIEVPLPVEARSRLALRVPSVYRRGRALRVPLARVSSEQVLSECRALGIEVRASRVVGRDSPSRRRVAEGGPRCPAGPA